MQVQAQIDEIDRNLERAERRLRPFLTSRSRNFLPWNVQASKLSFNPHAKKNLWPFVAGLAMLLAIMAVGVMLYSAPSKIATNEDVLARLTAVEKRIASTEKKVDDNSGRQDAVMIIATEANASIDRKIEDGLAYVLASANASQTAYETFAENRAGERDLKRESALMAELDALNNSFMLLKTELSQCKSGVHGLSWKLTQAGTKLQEDFNVQSNASIARVRHEIAVLSLTASKDVTKLRKNISEVTTQIQDAAVNVNALNVQHEMLNATVVNTTNDVARLRGQIQSTKDLMDQLFGENGWLCAYIALGCLVSSWVYMVCSMFFDKPDTFVVRPSHQLRGGNAGKNTTTYLDVIKEIVLVCKPFAFPMAIILFVVVSLALALFVATHIPTLFLKAWRM